MERRGIKAAALLLLAGSWAGAARGQAGERAAAMRSYAVKDFGAACDGASDDSAAVQKAIAKAEAETPYSQSATIEFCPGAKMVISSTLAIRNAEGWILHGNGVVVEWRGSSGVPVFDFSSVRNSTIEQFLITPYEPAKDPIGTAIRIEESAGEGVSTHNTFRNIIIEGIHEGVNIGFELAKGTAGDNNNDEMTFQDNEVRNYVTAAFQIEHSQSVSHRMYGNVCYGNGIGKYCVNQVDGNFAWLGGEVLGDAEADFHLQSADTFHPVDIIAANSESSARFLETGGPTGAPWPVNIEGCRFATNRLKADGRMIVYQAPGPLNITGSDFGEAGRPGTIWLNPGSLEAPGQVAANITGNSFTWANSRGSSILSGATRGVNLSTNVYVDGGYHAAEAAGTGK